MRNIHFCIHGATSLIGKNFCRRLIDDSVEFTVFSRNKSNLTFLENNPKVNIFRYEKSISELLENVSLIKNSIFINLAWAGVFGTEKNNPIQITFNIPELIYSIELAKKIECKHWIGFGSQAEYGLINGRADENHKCEPVTLYGKSKLLCSTISEELCRFYNMEWSWLRLFSAYGPYGNHKWFVDYLIDEILNNRTINVTKCEQYLDYLHTDDISELLITLADKKGVGIINLGFGKAIQLKEIIEKIKEITKSSSIINYGAVPYKLDQGMFNEADITKICDLSGWQPKVNIAEGMRSVIDKIQKK